jgi:hypothetical protein
MSASTTSATVRFWNVFAALAAASFVIPLLLPAHGLAAAPGARTSAMTSLEEALIITPDLDPAEVRQPVIGYVRRTEDGWRVDMMPGAVPRTGPLPLLTTTTNSALEDMTAQSIAPFVPLLRVDF